LIDWIGAHFSKIQREEEISKAKNILESREALENKIKESMDRIKDSNLRNGRIRRSSYHLLSGKRKLGHIEIGEEKKEEEEVLILDDLLKEDEEGIKDEDEENNGHIPETNRDLNEAFYEESKQFQVIFTSRTHSQLGQFVKELRRSPFATSTKVVSLGSRSFLCINPDVKILNNEERITEMCIDKQRSGKNPNKKSKESSQNSSKSGFLSKCQFHLSDDDESLLRDKILVL